MRRRRGPLLGISSVPFVLFVLSVPAACTASSTSADDTAAPSTIEDSGDPELGELTRVTGAVTTAELTGALDGAARLPLVLSVPSSGGGNGAIITGVAAPGGDTVVWDGGRPITLSGDGTVSVQPGPFRIADGNLFADLSGAAHPLAPGTYAVAGPVAVGDGRGLAMPSTETSFTASELAVLSGTGQVKGRLPPGTWTVIGPGRVSLSGDLVAQTAEHSVPAVSATLEAGSHEVTVVVGDDGIVTVEAILEGEVVVGSVHTGSSSSGD